MKKVELLMGEPRERESRRAIIACNDYLRMGSGRTLVLLGQRYRVSTQNNVPTTSQSTIEFWSKRFDWQARAGAYDAELERQKNEAEAKRREEILGSGFALHYERVSALKEVADLLLTEIRAQAGEDEVDPLVIGVDASTASQRERPSVWLRDVKQIGAGEDAEKVAIVRFNAAIFDKFYQALDDIAKEVGERVTKTQSEMTLEGELDINHGVDPEQYERAVAALADALRASLSQPSLSRPNAVAAPEQAAVAGVSEPG